MAHNFNQNYQRWNLEVFLSTFLFIFAAPPQWKRWYQGAPARREEPAVKNTPPPAAAAEQACGRRRSDFVGCGDLYVYVYIFESICEILWVDLRFYELVSWIENWIDWIYLGGQWVRNCIVGPRIISYMFVLYYIPYVLYLYLMPITWRTSNTIQVWHSSISNSAFTLPKHCKKQEALQGPADMEVDGDTPAKRVATGGKHRCQHVHGEISSGSCFQGWASGAGKPKRKARWWGHKERGQSGEGCLVASPLKPMTLILWWIYCKDDSFQSSQCQANLISIKKQWWFWWASPRRSTWLKSPPPNGLFWSFSIFHDCKLF